MAANSSRPRIRELIPRIHLGLFSPGPLNAITDVPGVLVHTQSIIEPANSEHQEINTGVTTILPRRNIWKEACYAGTFRFNGAGELTGAHWLNETGLLSSPIIITGTFGVGAAHEGAIRHFVRETRDEHGLVDDFTLPVVAETWDGYLSDVSALPVRPEHIVRGIDEAHSGPVAEGSTGGGTAMGCHGYKAGTGTASRKVPVRAPSETTISYTLGALVQANYGLKEQLRIAGVPVGLKLAEEDEKEGPPLGDGSIIIILATEIPLQPLQLQRLAKRSTVGLARVGGSGANSSGDIFLAFSTAANVVLDRAQVPSAIGQVDSIRDDEMSPLFDAAADAVEEAIYNALCRAEPVTGPRGRTVDTLPLEKVKSLVQPRLL